MVQHNNANDSEHCKLHATNLTPKLLISIGGVTQVMVFKGFYTL